MNRKHFLNVLENTKPGTASSGIVDAMSCFYFSGKFIITYNEKISIHFPFKTDFSLFVKADDLYKIISKSSAEDILIKEGKGKLCLSTKTMRANLSTIQDDEMMSRINIVEESLEGAEFKDVAEDFISSISLCAVFASTQESEQALTCVRISGKECVASDNIRIAYARMCNSMDEMFIKASEIKTLSKINPTQYAITDAWLHFKNEEGCVFSIRKIEASFPEFLQLFDFEGAKVNLPENLIEGMSMATIFTDAMEPAVNLIIEKETCIISVNSESGDIKYRSAIAYTGSKIKFSINLNCFKEMMNHSAIMTISQQKAKLEVGNFALVTALIRA